MKTTMSLAAAMGTLALTATSANATTIFTESFENPSISTDPNGETDEIPTGWLEAGQGGLNHGPNMGKFSTPFGDQAAWINNGTLTTTATILSDVLTAGTTYTLSFNVAKRTDLNGSYDVRLLAGTTVLESTSGSMTLTDMSESDGFVFTPDGSHAALLGQTLAIQLAGSTQPHYDNVILTAVPEPSTTALLGLGGLALILRRRK